MSKLTLMSASVVALCGMILGIGIGLIINQPIPTLTETQKRNITIDFLAKHGSWRYVLCTMPMDSQQPERENENAAH